MDAGEREHWYDEILERSTHLRDEAVALRQRNAAVLEQVRQAEGDRQRLRDDADAVEEQREIERELHGLPDPKA